MLVEESFKIHVFTIYLHVYVYIYICAYIYHPDTVRPAWHRNAGCCCLHTQAQMEEMFGRRGKGCWTIKLRPFKGHAVVDVIRQKCIYDMGT